MVPGAAEMVSGGGGSVVTLGEALVCFAAVDGLLHDATLFERSFGGAEANTAIGLARLGDEVTWISRVSADGVGDHIVGVLARQGVDVSRVTRSETAQTGLIVKERPTPHESRWTYYRSESAATELTPEHLDRDRVAEARVLHVTGITMSIGDGPRDLALEAVRVARAAGTLVTFDPNFRPQLVSEDDARAMFLAVVPAVDHLLCNDFEAELITGIADPAEAVRELAAIGPSVVLIKRGARGVTALVDGVLTERAAEFAPNPVDPTGAGDAFNAGWIHGVLHDLPVAARLGLAAFVAAQVVQHPGDFDGFPQRELVDGWLSADDRPSDVRG